MVQVLQPRPTFASQLGGGLGQGISQAAQLFAQNMMKEKQFEREKEMLGLKGEQEKELLGLKTQGKEQEAAKSKETTQGAFNELVRLVPEVGPVNTFISRFTPFGSDSKAFGKFSSLTGALESQLVEMVNKGTLSNTRFKYITETLLPKPTDTQSQIRGKLEGLAQIMDLDASALTGKSQDAGLESELKRRGLL